MIDGRNSLGVLFDALDRELSRSGGRVHLVIVGGSALLAHGTIDRPTQDVDVVALSTGDTLISSEPLPAELLEAAARVALNFGLMPGWLNSGPTSLLSTASGLPDGFAERLIPAFEGEYLVVAVASRLDLVYLKLYAFADRRAPRDEADLRALNATADELRGAARWARSHNMPGPFDERVRAALAAFGIDDEGRADD
jgi:hypothetical protein